MRILPIALVVAAVAWTAPLSAEDVPVQQIQAMVEKLVEKVVACQDETGKFVLGHAAGKDAGIYPQAPQGQTALAILALQYAKPHLTGDTEAKVGAAIKRGIAYLSQQEPEKWTYSAGLIITVLFQEHPDRYKKPIDAYAKMLCMGQHATGDTVGTWGYKVPGPDDTNTAGLDLPWGDNSNGQVALLGLYNAEHAGFQVPKVVWQRAIDHYVKSQAIDGGWAYKVNTQQTPIIRPKPYSNMTIASTISLQLCEEMLNSEGHAQCKPPKRSKSVEGGLNWIAVNWNNRETEPIGYDPYGLYALERLGILMGRANIGGHDWYNEGANIVLNLKQLPYWAAPETSYCFAIAFLCRGLEPIIFNKLEREKTDDWNNDPYDIKHVTEFLHDRFQLAVQWRIVTLDAPMTLLLKTPILYISGHDKLDFTPQEKDRLKLYTSHGGTILAQACCSRKPFDDSFRALVKEVYGSELRPFPATSRLFERMKMRGLAPKPEVLYATDATAEGATDQGRPVVIYLPHDVCCRWQQNTKDSLAIGAGIYLFVANECRKMFLAEHGAKTALPNEPDKPLPAVEQPPTPPEEPVAPEQPDTTKGFGG